jgi:hypothetical protein
MRAILKVTILLVVILFSCNNSREKENPEKTTKIEEFGITNLYSNECDSILELDECEILRLIGEKGEFYRMCYDKFFIKLSNKSGIPFKTKFSYSTVGMLIEIDSLEYDIKNFQKGLKCK